jgi:hypothetical protein
LVNKKVLIHIQSDTIPKAAAGTKRLNQSRHETGKPNNNNPKLNTNKRRDQRTFMQQIHQHHQNTQANQSKNIKTESI